MLEQSRDEGKIKYQELNKKYQEHRKLGKELGEKRDKQRENRKLLTQDDSNLSFIEFLVDSVLKGRKTEEQLMDHFGFDDNKDSAMLCQNIVIIMEKINIFAVKNHLTDEGNKEKLMELIKTNSVILAYIEDLFVRICKYFNFSVNERLLEGKQLGEEIRIFAERVAEVKEKGFIEKYI